jgi:hypothetical protein
MFNYFNASITEARSIQNAKMQSACEKSVYSSTDILPILFHRIIYNLWRSSLRNFNRVPPAASDHYVTHTEISAQNTGQEVNLSFNIAQFCNNLTCCSLQAGCSTYMKDRLISHCNTSISESSTDVTRNDLEGTWILHRRTLSVPPSLSLTGGRIPLVRISEPIFLEVSLQESPQVLRQEQWTTGLCYKWFLRGILLAIWSKLLVLNSYFEYHPAV